MKTPEDLAMTTTTPQAANLGVSKPQTQLRGVQSHQTMSDRLGALKNLPGFWEGTGFSLIARPDFSGRSKNGFFLQLNALRETIEFTTIGSPVLNRGSMQDDISIYGVTYLHRVTDGETGGALHVEPGMWLNIPATTAPKADASIARMGTIPHGNAFCTVGFVIHEEVDGMPDIPKASTVPFADGAAAPEPGAPNPFAEYDLSQACEFRTEPLPPGITQAHIDDPRQILRDTNIQLINQGAVFNEVDLLITNSPDAGGIANIPFITANANALQMESVFGIQTMTDTAGNEYLQMQYSQIAMLNFRGMSFPHITVGTLIKAF